MKRCVIIGSAPMLNEQAVLEKLLPDDDIICADGGMDFCNKHHIVPQLLVGDFDSYSGALPQNVKTLQLPTEKDDTDLHYAVKTAIEAGYNNFLLLGVTGGKRPEHTFAAVATLLYLSNRQKTSLAFDGVSTYRVFSGLFEFQSEKECYLSVFSMGERPTVVTINGAKYPLNHATLSAEYPLGVSNEFSGSCTVLAESGAVLAITTPKE